jgi:hypothetical protein
MWRQEESSIRNREAAEKAMGNRRAASSGVDRGMFLNRNKLSADDEKEEDGSAW